MTGVRRGIVFAAGLLATLTVGFAENVTGPGVSFTLLYLVPIVFVTWFAGLWLGVATCAVGAEVWLLADLARPMPAHHSAPYLNATLELGVFMLVAVLLSSLKTRLRREEALARADSLTGLPNRRSFFEAAERELARLRRHSLPLTLAYIDVDDFKRINDRFGHQAGDAVLALIASELRRSIREVDVAARIGGDEFALLLPETDAATARILLDRLNGTLRIAMDTAGWALTFSVGAVTFSRAPETAEEMVRRVDQLMYDVKGAGKNALRHETAII